MDELKLGCSELLMPKVRTPCGRDSVPSASRHGLPHSSMSTLLGGSAPLLPLSSAVSTFPSHSSRNGRNIWLPAHYPRAPGPTCMCLVTFWSAHSICIQELLESAEFQPINHLIYLFGGQIHIINGSRNWNMFDFRSWSFNTDMFGSNVIFFRKVNFYRIRTMRRRLAWLRQVDGFRFHLEKSVSFAVQKDDRCPMPDAWFVGQMLMIIWKWFVGVIEKREFNCF